MRGAEANAMGLLLKERIVFLGSSIDDFVADAIIRQLSAGYISYRLFERLWLLAFQLQQLP